MNRSGRAGDGDRWVLLHGTPLTPAVWDEVAAHLRQAGPVVCPEITPPGGVQDAQHDLAARLVLDVAGRPDRVHVVGHSFGGQVALDLALLAPQRVRTLTILCSRDTPFPPFAAAAESLRRGDPVDLDAALDRWFTQPELESAGAVVTYARRCLNEAEPQSWAVALDAMAGYDRAGRAASVQIPVTLIAAELDQVSPPAAMAAFASHLPQGRLQVLPHAAHLTPFTDPGALAQRILSASRAGPR
jgi:pimeloyl-ACP methyl ester carboxylesterase